MGNLVRICWLITLIATMPATFMLFAAIFNSSSALQEAAGAAMALAIVVIPYIFTRAFSGAAGKDDDEK